MTQYEIYQYTYEFGYGFNLINDAYNNISERITAEPWGRLQSIAKNESNNAVEFAQALRGVFKPNYTSCIYPCEYAGRIFEYCDEYARKKEAWYNRYISDDEPNKDISCGERYNEAFNLGELMFFSQEPSAAVVIYNNTNVAVYFEPDGFKIILLNYTPSLFSLDDENDKNEIQLYKNECKNRGNFIKQYNGVVFIPFTPYNLTKAIRDAENSFSKVLGNLRPLITSR